MKSLQRLAAFGVYVLALMDWLVSFVERAIVLMLGFAIVYLSFALLAGRDSQADIDIISKLAENWRIVFFLLIPIFYRVIRKFLEEVYEAFGMKRPQPGQPVGGEETRKPPQQRS